MSHTKFNCNRITSSGEENFLKGFTVYGLGGHLNPRNKFSFSPAYRGYIWELGVLDHNMVVMYKCT